MMALSARSCEYGTKFREWIRARPSEAAMFAKTVMNLDCFLTYFDEIVPGPTVSRAATMEGGTVGVLYVSSTCD
jgi:hypothetical protein